MPAHVPFAPLTLPRVWEADYGGRHRTNGPAMLLRHYRETQASRSTFSSDSVSSS
jgi:hypothetical protein